ncbi:MAG: hypothetical protein JWP37_4615 [Mucilaginibacter sp.]|nr:hypothetical protein [Mucilaginibacter sp.]
MQRITAFKLLLTLAAMVFVAKPFFGFGAFNQQLRPRQTHSIFVKSFTKRKPESLEEADEKIEAVHQLLINPFVTIISTISFLLLTLFPLAFKNNITVTSGFLSAIHFALLPPERAYLLTGKLLI